MGRKKTTENLTSSARLEHDPKVLAESRSRIQVLIPAKPNPDISRDSSPPASSVRPTSTAPKQQEASCKMPPAKKRKTGDGMDNEANPPAKATPPKTKAAPAQAAPARSTPAPKSRKASASKSKTSEPSSANHKPASAQQQENPSEIEDAPPIALGQTALSSIDKPQVSGASQSPAVSNPPAILSAQMPQIQVSGGSQNSQVLTTTPAIVPDLSLQSSTDKGQVSKGSQSSQDMPDAPAHAIIPNQSTKSSMQKRQVSAESQTLHPHVQHGEKPAPDLSNPLPPDQKLMEQRQKLQDLQHAAFDPKIPQAEQLPSKGAVHQVPSHGHGHGAADTRVQVEHTSPTRHHAATNIQNQQVNSAHSVPIPSLVRQPTLQTSNAAPSTMVQNMPPPGLSARNFQIQPVASPQFLHNIHQPFQSPRLNNARQASELPPTRPPINTHNQSVNSAQFSSGHIQQPRPRVTNSTMSGTYGMPPSEPPVTNSTMGGTHGMPPSGLPATNLTMGGTHGMPPSGPPVTNVPRQSAQFAQFPQRPADFLGLLQKLKSSGHGQARASEAPELIAGIPRQDIRKFIGEYAKYMGYQGEGMELVVDKTQAGKNVLEVLKKWDGVEVIVQNMEYAPETFAAKGLDVGYAIATEAIRFGFIGILNHAASTFHNIADTAENELAEMKRNPVATQKDINYWGRASLYYILKMELHFYRLAKEGIEGVYREYNAKCHQTEQLRQQQGRMPTPVIHATSIRQVPPTSQAAKDVNSNGAENAQREIEQSVDHMDVDTEFTKGAPGVTK